MIALRCLAFATLVSAPFTVWADTYPSHPIKLVVAYSAGGTNDIVARVVAQKMTEGMKSSVVVENRAGGAGGVVGAQTVAKSPPDGYTLLLANTTILAINPALQPTLPYDPQSDFEPVSVLATSPLLLVINASLPATNVAEFVALLRANPGKYSYASAGVGTPLHVVAELFRIETATEIVHVPYRGASPAVADLVAGRVHMIFDNVPSVLPHIRSGALRALAVAGPSRIPQLPDTPTVSEAGLGGADTVSWYAIVAPHGTRHDVLERLNREISAATKDPEVRKRLVDLGAEPWGSTVDETKAHIRREAEKWARFIKDLGIKAD